MKTAQVLRRLVWEEWGGIETVVTSTSRALERCGVTAQILATAALSAAGEERRAGLTIRRFGYSYTRLPSRDMARRALDLKGGNPTSPGLVLHLLRERGLDLVNCHTMGRVGGQVRWACQRRGIPYVVTLHGGHFAVPEDEKRRLAMPTRGSVDAGRPLDLLFGTTRYLADASAVIALSQVELDRARRELPHTPSFPLRNGVDVDHFASATPEQGRLWRRERAIAADAPLVVCVARLDPQKGQDRLVEAVARCGAAWHLALVGPESVPGTAAALKALADKAGLGPRLHLVGPLAPDSDALRQAYAAADVVALASRHEPFGVVLLEAWAACRPIVATCVGGIPSFVTNRETGLLVEDGDVDGFASALQALWRQPDLALRLARAGLALARQRYDWASIALDLQSIYEEALRHHRIQQRGPRPA